MFVFWVIPSAVIFWVYLTLGTLISGATYAVPLRKAFRLQNAVDVAEAVSNPTETFPKALTF